MNTHYSRQILEKAKDMTAPERRRYRKILAEQLTAAVQAADTQFKAEKETGEPMKKERQDQAKMLNRAVLDHMEAEGHENYYQAYHSFAVTPRGKRMISNKRAQEIRMQTRKNEQKLKHKPL